MRRLAALLRSPKAGAVLLGLLLAVSIGVPAVAAIAADGGQQVGDVPSVGVLSTAAIGGLHRLLLGDAAARSVSLEAPLLAALVVPFAPECDRPAGNAYLAEDPSWGAFVSHGPAVPLRI